MEKHLQIVGVLLSAFLVILFVVALVSCKTRTETVYIMVTPTPIEGADVIETGGSATDITPIPTEVPTSTPQPPNATVTNTAVPTNTKVPTKTPIPTTTATPSTASAEMRLFDLHNIERAKAGIHELSWDADLARVAEYRSKDMAEKDYFSHTAPAGDDFGFLLRNWNIPFRTAGENICYLYKAEPDKLATTANSLFMNSEGHRRNILNSNFNRVGISFVLRPSDNRVYCTVIFGG